MLTSKIICLGNELIGNERATFRWFYEQKFTVTIKLTNLLYV